MHSKRLFSWKFQMAEMGQSKSAHWVKIASAPTMIFMVDFSFRLTG
jgi:hypothetical protein